MATQGLIADRRRPNGGMLGAPGCPMPLCCADRGTQKHHWAARRSIVTLVGAGVPDGPKQSAWRAAARSVRHAASEVPGSGSGMRGEPLRVSALAATLVPPLGSPYLRGGKGTLPLVVFLFGVQEPFLFPQEEREMGLEIRRPEFMSGQTDASRFFRKRESAPALPDIGRSRGALFKDRCPPQASFFILSLSQLRMSR